MIKALGRLLETVYFSPAVFLLTIHSVTLLLALTLTFDLNLTCIPIILPFLDPRASKHLLLVKVMRHGVQLPCGGI